MVRLIREENVNDRLMHVHCTINQHRAAGHRFADSPVLLFRRSIWLRIIQVNVSHLPENQSTERMIAGS